MKLAVFVSGLFQVSMISCHLLWAIRSITSRPSVSGTRRGMFNDVDPAWLEPSHRVHDPGSIRGPSQSHKYLRDPSTQAYLVGSIASGMHREILPDLYKNRGIL